MIRIHQIRSTLVRLTAFGFVVAMIWLFSRVITIMP